MNTKQLNIAFWVITGLFAAFMTFSGVMNIIQPEEMMVEMNEFGYPSHFFTMLGIAKILGAVALVFRKFKTITEWAYAGFTFDIVAAFIAHAAVGKFGGIVLIFLVILFASYYLSKKLGK